MDLILKLLFNLLKNILKSTSFDQMHALEKTGGFVESRRYFSKNNKTEYFFRKGTEKQWEKELTKRQLVKIESSFGPTMRELGYLK